MSTAHIKNLEAIRQQKKALQEKENKIISEAITELSTSLIYAHALDINYDILIGGVLDVIDKTKQGDKITEAWKLSGEKFRKGQKKRNSKKNNAAPKKDKENKNVEK